MGNSFEVNFPKRNQNIWSKQKFSKTKTHLENNLSTFSNHFNIQNKKSIKLSALRGYLNAQQCFYTLSTLIQQYFSLLKLYKKVVVSDSLCLVNQYGELKVDFCIDGPDTHLLSYSQVTHSFITAISQIISLVERLAIGKDELQDSQCNYFRQSLIEKIHNYYQNDQIIYHQVIQLLNSFMQINDIKCNLIDAYLRYWNQAKSEYKIESLNHQSTPFLANSRINQGEKYSLSSNDHAYHQIQSSLNRNQDTVTRQSHSNNQTKSINAYKIQPRYKHKIVKTEGQNYYTSMSKKNESFRPSTFFQETSNTRYEKTVCNKISHQYTVNILNSRPSNQKCLKKCSKKINKSTNSLVSAQSYENRIQTSLNELAEYKLEDRFQVERSYAKSYARSMLQQLARSVSIRDQPNSRDHIN